MINYLHKQRITILLFIIICIFVYGSMGWLLWAAVRQTPPNTHYAFSMGYLYDYYQYVSWIKSGQLGDLLLTDRYTEEPQLPRLFNPWFLLFGFLTRPLHAPSYIMFYVFRASSILLYLSVLYVVFVKTFSSLKERIFGTFILIGSGSFWWYTRDGGLGEPIDWSKNFNVIEKFYLSPHHAIALACILTCLYLLHTKHPLQHMVPIFFVLAIVAGFANPYFLSLTNLILITSSLVQLVINKKAALPQIKRNGMYILCTIPVISYHSYLSTHFYPWTQMFSKMFLFNPTVSMKDYLLALGPTGPLALIVLFFRKLRTNPLVLTLLSWTVLPLTLFPFTSTLLPMNSTRVFQSYQYIPLFFLSTYAGSALSPIVKKYVKGVSFFALFAIIIVAYNSIPVVLSLERLKAQTQPHYYNHYIPDSLLAAFAYLEKQTPPNSVVLSGEYVSSMIPAFTPNRVILGRADATRDYETKQIRTFDFFDAKLTQKDTRQFLEDYAIDYILFGVDTRPLSDHPLKNAPFGTEVFRSSAVSVVKIH